MKNRNSRGSLRRILILIPCIVMALLLIKPAESADFTTYSTYCQYPPYVFQSKLPNVMILVSNSYSMSGFAYQNNTADNVTNASGGFIPGHNYYGLFDPRYWYDRTNSGWTKKTEILTVSDVDLSPTSKPNADYWHGSFLNWLTMRRVDVMKKLLTGGYSPGGARGYQSCSSDNTLWKTFSDNGTYPYTEVPANTTGDIFVKFSHDAGCTGADVTKIEKFFQYNSSMVEVPLLGGLPQPILISKFDADDGIIQKNLPKAQIGLAFYDVNGDGANIVVPVAASWGQADYNRLKTPALFNNSADQPVADALFTIAGYFAQVNNSNSLITDLGGGCTSTSPCGPIYTTAYPIGRNTSRDPYFQHDHISTCAKANVIVISDGEPCSDGNLPPGLATFADTKGSPFTCNADGDCSEAPGFEATTGLPGCTPRSNVIQTGRNKGSLEDVSLWAHTTDLRNDTALPGKQELDIWIVRAFGLSTSNLLKYAAINGSFTDNGSGVPSAGSYDLSTSYFEATDPYAIEAALNNIFTQLLKRAASGTAASVLASGQGSGANLVQAVFYPKRRFGDQIIDWTGSLSNLWYYIDPFFGNSSILEDSNKEPGSDYYPILNLDTDKKVTLYFDESTQTTKALIGDSTTGVPFEEVKSLWEAGALLHDPTTSSSRTIFTAGVVSGAPPVRTDFTTGNNGTLRSSLGAANDDEASAIIEYIRGVDSIYRQRQVLYANVDNTNIDNTVWKLGDIINSTPKIVSSVALNTYDSTNKDDSYRAFLKTDTYKKRGMVFAGGNDGMLHAFKLGRLLLPGDNATLFPRVAEQKAKLYNDNTLARFGSERWGYIPKNALPYLKAILDNNYCHLYYVDQSPVVFDASIGGADDASRPLDGSSWRTILIGGMRLGGACRDYAAGATNVKCASTDTDNNCVASPVSGGGLSSYFALDVTNPEDPAVLWEFTDNTLGFTTTGPAVVRVNELTGTVPDQSLNGKWYVVFGSGPTGPITNRQFMGKSDQNLKLFIVDLKTGTLQRTIGSFNDNSTTPVPITKAFAGSMINATADFNLDYQDDVVYIPYVQNTSSTSTPTWDGGVVRLQMNQDRNPDNWSASVVTKGVGPITSAVVRLQNNTFHTNWLYFGAGRYYFSSPLLADDSAAQRYLFGMKEPCFTSLNTITNSCNGRVSVGSLTPVGDTTVISGEPASGWSIALDGPGSADFDGSGSLSYQAERVITDSMSLASGKVLFTTFLPYADECAVGGRTFLWAVRYNTGMATPMRGTALMQTSTASIEQLNLGTAFSYTPSGVNVDVLHRGGRRSYSIEGSAGGPPSFFVPPRPVKRILHMKER